MRDREQKRDREEESPTQEKKPRVVGPLPLRVPLKSGAAISWPTPQSLVQATSAHDPPPVPLAPLAPLSSPLDPIAEAKKALETIAQWMRPIEILDEKKVRLFVLNSSVQNAIKVLRSTTVPVCLHCKPPYNVNNHQTDDCRIFKARQERAAQQAQPSLCRPPTTGPPTPAPSLASAPSVAAPITESFPRLKPSIEAQGFGPEFEEALHNGELQLRMTNNPARGWPMYAHNTSPWDQPAKPLHPALLLEHPLDNCLFDDDREYDVSRFPLEAWLPPISKEREDALCPPHLYTLKAPPEERKYKWPT